MEIIFVIQMLFMTLTLTASFTAFWIGVVDGTVGIFHFS
jgi:hypothetical protein